MSQEFRYVYPDADALARAAASDLAQSAKRSVAERDLFTLALAGGSTPKRLYSLLGTDPAYRDFPWDKTHLFFGDERHVPPDHADSNYLMVKTTLLSSGLVPEKNVHRIRAELPDAHQAAADYEVEMHSFFNNALRLGNFPRFDFILLGMGPDGHTASLFPDSRGLEEKERWVLANPVEKFKTDRITFSFPVLNAARAVYLLVAGPDKTDMIYNVLVKDRNETVYPVQRVVPIDGAKTWMLDQAAAARLPQTPD
jgi:6-phosphogluconolactonase